MPFMLVRYDVDFMVLPVKYLEEIRLMKESKLSSRSAQVGVSMPSGDIATRIFNRDVPYSGN